MSVIQPCPLYLSLGLFPPIGDVVALSPVLAQFEISLYRVDPISVGSGMHSNWVSVESNEWPCLSDDDDADRFLSPNPSAMAGGDCKPRILAYCLWTPARYIEVPFWSHSSYSHHHNPAHIPYNMLGMDLIRDSTIGQLINLISDGKLLPFEDQKPGFVLRMPHQPVVQDDTASTTDSVSTRVPSRVPTPDSPKELEAGGPPTKEVIVTENPALDEDAATALARKTAELVASMPPEFLVDWWGPDDPENPR